MQHASLIKRFIACLYELLSLIAIWLLCTLVFMLLFGEAETPSKRFLLQMVLWILTGGYFVFCWVKTGQTLAMQTWKIKLLNVDNERLSLGCALSRYVLATMSLCIFGIGFFWSLFDKEKLFLHDRILNTRLVQLAPLNKKNKAKAR